MDIFQFFLLQLLAHILADYTFQTDRKAADKNEKGFKSKFLKWHALILFISAWLLSFQVYFVIGALLIALTHYIIDGFKPKLNRSASLGRYAFFIDQGMHLVILCIIIYTYSIYFKLDTIVYLNINSRYLAVGIGYLICGKPANMVIKEIFKASKIEFEGMNKEDLPNAGRLIGVVERWLVLTFILIGQFSAVGFLIAAKSILRYKDEEKGINKSEYVLIGTLISFAMAIGMGILLGGPDFQ
jgi:Flp pilus assembly pilin Flp